MLRDPAVFARAQAALSRTTTAAAVAAADDDDDAGTAAESGHRATGVPGVVGLAEQYLSLCLQHPPTTVWYREGEGPCDVVRRHFGWILQHHPLASAGLLQVRQQHLNERQAILL